MFDKTLRDDLLVLITNLQELESNIHDGEYGDVPATVLPPLDEADYQLTEALARIGGQE